MRLASLFITFLCLVSIIIFTSCEKEYSYEGGPLNGIATGTAIYTLAGAGGNCSGPVINGNYIAGKPLLPSNNIQLRVNVTMPGTYAITTSVINGFQFSGSGNFTTTGLQAITLMGSGTPAATGMSAFTPPVGLGCTFFVAVTSAQPQVAQYTLLGAPGGCSSFKLSGNYIAGFPLTSANTAEVTVNVTSVGPYSIHTDTVDAMSFSKSGNFTATGIQKVILNGIGAPLIPGILSITAAAGSSNCNFTVTVVTPGPPATYVLESNQDQTCTGYSVTGFYAAGTPLLNTDNIAVKVNVTVLGNFTISTNTVNGMTFSHTGEFIGLGSQAVILTGSGTPDQPGTFSFTPQIVGPHPIGGETCTANVTVP